MGVGAVFVSTLALTRLPVPQSPPQNETEHLAATLQIIVSFVVLGSIFIRSYFFSSPPICSMLKSIHARRIVHPVLQRQSQHQIAHIVHLEDMDSPPIIRTRMAPQRKASHDGNTCLKTPGSGAIVCPHRRAER